MSPKKTTSKKPAASRSDARKKSTKAVASGETSVKSPKKGGKKAAPKPAPASTKPDQMPDDVLEFIQAIDDYKRLEGRPFPTWSEVLDIVKDLGYQRQNGQ
ncbi:hypothetical protein Poly30_29230 [Planctomycetes bacterium Poly30]|uniref:Uncharacterized protein n=1 Tax=Saltatorellus ferox TaxID=2528018 RepID=A0A518ETI3_9BACT|nr:hypothetical protein Poly30_29230 [Planctomycetes bacterium Poly30]